MAKEKINLPTKITIGRIILAALLLLSIFILYFLDQFKVLNISDFNITLNSKGGTINIINIVLFVALLLLLLLIF